MKKLLVCVWLVFTGYLLLMPATQFQPVTYSDEGVTVTVSIEADTPWVTPFNETVNLSIGVAPIQENITQVNITRVSLFVHTSEVDSTDLVLAAIRDYEASPITTGASSAEMTHAFRMKGSQSGKESYFSLAVQGAYRNETGAYSFHALSSETLVGPFEIARGIQSVQSIVGIAVAAASTILIAVAIVLFRRSQKPKRRKTLLEED